MQYLSTADVDSAVFAWIATPVRKIFTTDVGPMQRRRHHMTATARGLSLSKLPLASYYDGVVWVGVSKDVQSIKYRFSHL